MSWRPLSKRNVPDARLDEPAEGIPAWMVRPVFGWVINLLVDHDPLGIDQPQTRGELIDHLAMQVRLDRPLQFKYATSAVDDLINRMDADHELALDVIDYLLAFLPRWAEGRAHPNVLASNLRDVLRDAGSVWDVVLIDDRYGLQRRTVGPVREVITELPPASRAREHLVAAWNRLMGRSPDASSAYREAVKAVEAAAKPVVLPDSARATLGTMIAAMRDKPEKWTTSLGTVEDIRLIMETLWTSQLDRHGTDEKTAPLNVSLEQADAAVHLAITLTRFFLGGHVRRAANRG